MEGKNAGCLGATEATPRRRALITQATAGQDAATALPHPHRSAFRPPRRLCCDRERISCRRSGRQKGPAKRIRRGSHSSVDDLEDAIHDDLMQHNTQPKPVVWRSTAEDILTRERRALAALDGLRGNGQHASDQER